MEKQSAGARFYEIDLLRFIAAFAVLLYHYTFRGAAKDGLSTLSYPWLVPATIYGHLGVDLFFLISGFVILMTAASGSWRAFLVSRIVRLYPAFWVCCFVSYMVSLFSASGRHVASVSEYLLNNTMVSGFANVPYIDGVYWSLLVEMKFYFLVFIVLLFKQIHRAGLLLGLWLAAYVVAGLLHVKVLTIILIPGFAPYFVAGAMFYLVSRDGISLYKLAVIALAYGVIAYQSIGRAAEFDELFHTVTSPVVICVIVASFFAIFFLIATGRTRFLASRNFLVLGSLTYPLYLLHQNIGFAIFNAVYPGLNVHVVMWGVAALMIAAAYVVTRIEKAIQKPFKAGLNRLLLPAAAAAPARSPS